MQQKPGAFLQDLIRRSLRIGHALRAVLMKGGHHPAARVKRDLRPPRKLCFQRPPPHAAGCRKIQKGELRGIPEPFPALQHTVVAEGHAL